MIANLEFKKTNFKDKIISVLQSDVRIVQILLMGTLLSIGVYFRDFSIHPMQIFLTFCSGLATHFLWNRILKIKVAILSTVITCFGLSLLLRSDLFWIHPAIVFLAISSKFIIRIRGKHLFNPAMFGVILGISLFPRTWVSPGQWGFELTIGIWLLVFGLIVSGRAGISDISYAFLLFHFLFLAYRIFRFGYQWDVLLH
ncbi:MAG TPA: hypothetical protein PKL30_21905 [Leptospiraceae bacterium]|nr:hypothetical protein [Leptospiraceae bacterium]